MTYIQLLRDIADDFGLEVVQASDTDYEIVLPEGKAPSGLITKLREWGFGVTAHGEEGSIMHVHAPASEERGWKERNWEGSVPGTDKLPEKQVLPGMEYTAPRISQN